MMQLGHERDLARDDVLEDTQCLRVFGAMEAIVGLLPEKNYRIAHYVS